ncbi:MAG: PIN domain-containing protein [Prevotella sp.]|nr:PIN domain-containing protein [Prevotella sp.]
MRYLLDTHAVVWLLSSQDTKLPHDLCESIRYCEDAFFISEISLIEIIQLQQIGKIDLNYSPAAIRDVIEQNNIMILPATTDVLEVFYALSIPIINGARHTDPFDRIIISTAIRRGITLISADQKFPWYAKNCQLMLREI